MDIATQFGAARRRILEGEQLTIDEQKQLILALRGARFGAAETSATAKKTAAAKKPAKGVSDDDLADEFASLGL